MKPFVTLAQIKGLPSMGISWQGQTNPTAATLQLLTGCYLVQIIKQKHRRDKQDSVRCTNHINKFLLTMPSQILAGLELHQCQISTVFSTKTKSVPSNSHFIPYLVCKARKRSTPAQKRAFLSICNKTQRVI